MSKLPFTLKINTHSPAGRCEKVLCHSVLRALGKTRMVYDATWGGRRIVLKVFSKFGKARHHAMREWRGLEQLQARKINSPEPLFCGRCPEGWVVATAWLDDAIAAEELWKAAETTERKVQIVGLIATELARHHDRGILQTDMHLGNFMIRGKEVFAIDPAMIRFVNNPIDRRESIRQLAQLAVLLPEGSGSPIESVFREYAAARSWTVGPQDVEQLHREHRRCRNRGVERGLRKFLRVNRRHQEIRNGAWRGLASRRFSEQTSLEALTTGLDEIMARGRILKNGRTAFVSRVTLGGMDVVVKRYNPRGFLYSLRHTLKGSRAQRSWLNANRLFLLGIPTPEPLAYVDQYKGLFLYCSYFITEFVPGKSLYTILRDPDTPENQKQRLVEEVIRTMDRMADHGVNHGDLKHTNILCKDETVVLIDLDGMRVGGLPWLRRCRHQKDRARFLRDIPRR